MKFIGIVCKNDFALIFHVLIYSTYFFRSNFFLNLSNQYEGGSRKITSLSVQTNLHGQENLSCFSQIPTAE